MFSTISILLLCLTQRYLGLQPFEDNLKYKNSSEISDFEGTSVFRHKNSKSSFTAKHSFVANIDNEQIVFRVVDGKIAKLGEIPYQVALMMGQTGGRFSAFCGGTIVGPDKIITAAHCVVKDKKICCKGELKKSDLKKMVVVAGQLRTVTRYGAEGQWRRPFTGKYPKRYKFPSEDIAVLYIKTPWKFNSAVQYVPFATKNEDYDLTCTASGYGRINKYTQAPELRQAQLKLLAKSKCNKIHHRDFSKFICTSDQVSDVYKGDSGGPLVCLGTTDPKGKNSSLGVLVGVVSGKDLVKKMGTFFTRVSSYHELLSCSSKPEISSWLLSFILFCYYYIALLYSFNLFYSTR